LEFNIKTKQKIHLWPEEPTIQEGFITTGFTLEYPQGDRFLAWYRLPEVYSNWITKGSNPFVLGALFTAMRTASDLVTHGKVSPILLQNLEEFQSAYASWYPQLYNRIDIQADIEKEQERSATTAAISTFSGGVDSCFTAWRHRKGKAGRSTRDLRAGLILHGFDIPIGRITTFERVTRKVKILLDSLNMEMIPMTFNLKKLGGNLIHTQGTFLGSCMSLLQGGFVTGIIPSTNSYANLNIRYGTNPITDHLLSSETFSIVHDNCSYSRSEKVREISNWPEALDHLRVCLREDRSERDKNCCRCEKCVRTILEFRSLGLGLPPCFEKDISANHIMSLKYNKNFIYFYKEIIKDSKKSKVSGLWVGAIYLSIFINRIRQIIKNSPSVRRIHQSTKKL